jgi:GT2 family glycosyltransferase
MMKLRYPDFEIIFVDDGSTDNTQEILKKFPSVRNIKQKNMGLSYARNVGMNAATGEIIVYTDSDCEADEDWLYYIALSLVRSGHKGMGGPNLIPDEGSWVADCVGLSPGGPTHVMINDREAEHVPGCNMAFYTWAAKEVNGFDPQYRAAGDDVDFIWRMQSNGHSIGFSPAAQVWHYRRNSIKAYLKQQRGYGTAEALLKYKHPDHFNSLGASHWRGKIYGGEQIGVRTGGDVIYHGVFGTGLFQTIYRRPASMLAAMLMSIEWHLLTGFVMVLGMAFLPLLWVGLGMFLVPIILAIVAAIQSPMPRHKHWLTRPLIAYLHWRQPITRGWARYAVRLKNKIMKGEATGYSRQSDLPYDPASNDTLLYWNQSEDRVHLLRQITTEVQKAGWRSRIDSGWNRWDMEIYGSRYAKVRITTATEEYGGSNGKTTRIRVERSMSKFCLVLLIATLLLTTLLLVHVWPFSRPAVLLPMAILSMYLVNRWQVTQPILGLIDQAAESAGFYPILGSKVDVSKPSKAEVPAKPQAGLDEEEEDGLAHV